MAAQWMGTLRLAQGSGSFRVIGVGQIEPRVSRQEGKDMPTVWAMGAEIPLTNAGCPIALWAPCLKELGPGRTEEGPRPQAGSLVCSDRSVAYMELTPIRNAGKAPPQLSRAPHGVSVGMGVSRGSLAAAHQDPTSGGL